MKLHRTKRSITTTIAGVVIAVSASCLTLGSVVWLFGTAAAHPAESATAAWSHPVRS